VATGMKHWEKLKEHESCCHRTLLLLASTVGSSETEQVAVHVYTHRDIDCATI
jgi:hypothetical protein